MEEKNDKKYLEDEYLKLLYDSQDLTKETIASLFKKTVELIQKDVHLHDVMICEAEREDAPIAQVGFTYDEETHQVTHLITVNYQRMMNFPIPRILLVAAHECGHLFASEEKTVQLEKGEISLDEYIDFVSRKSGDWYQQETELKADEFGFFRSKNIYQRAVHDVDDLGLKSYFWDCYRQIEMNEMIEMGKHQSHQEGDSKKTESIK